jgi:hypothetical protein
MIVIGLIMVVVETRLPAKNNWWLQQITGKLYYILANFIT